MTDCMTDCLSAAVRMDYVSYSLPQVASYVALMKNVCTVKMSFVVLLQIINVCFRVHEEPRESLERKANKDPR